MCLYKKIRSLLLALLLAVCATGIASGADSPADVLAQGPGAVLTRLDYDAEISRLPPDQRIAFATSAQRIEALLDNLYLLKALSAEARKAGIDKEPLVAARMSLDADKALGQMYLQKLEGAAVAEFDRTRAEQLPRARELYLVDQAKYKVPEQISASHILFSTKSRKPEEALVLAQDARAKLAAGADFNALAKQISDDPSAARNRGHLDWFSAQGMDPAFSKAAFALPKEGAISEPVLSSFGYHLIRLEGRRPPRTRSFDEVKDEVLDEMRRDYVNKQRDDRMAALRNNKDVKINDAAVQGLLKKVDPALFRPRHDARMPR